MKKLIILFFVLAASVSMSAQTYYYKYLNTVNSNGVKTKKENFYHGRDVYMTFVNNGNVLAPFTDKEGTNQGVYCNYTGSNSGIISYRGLNWDNSYAWGAALATYSMLGGFDNNVKNVKFHFSSDYSRLNIELSSGIIHVLERRSSPESEQAPSQLY